jgi:hypothetical protein
MSRYKTVIQPDEIKSNMQAVAAANLHVPMREFPKFSLRRG